MTDERPVEISTEGYEHLVGARRRRRAQRELPAGAVLSGVAATILLAGVLGVFLLGGSTSASEPAAAGDRSVSPTVSRPPAGAVGVRKVGKLPKRPEAKLAAPVDPAHDPTMEQGAVVAGFDRDVADGLAPITKRFKWRIVRGNWSQDSGTALVTGTTAGGAVAVVAATDDVTVETTLYTLANGSGLVFRFKDPKHYWAVQVSKRFSTFNVVKVDGNPAKPVFVAHSGLVPTRPGTIVSARVSGDAVTIVVNGAVTTFAQVDPAEGRRWVGLIAPAFVPKDGVRFAEFRLKKTS